MTRIAKSLGVAALVLPFVATMAAAPAQAATCLRRSYSASCSLQLRSPQRIVQSCAIKAWEDRVRASAGHAYANWNNAKGSVNCRQNPQLKKYQCTASGIPCRP